MAISNPYHRLWRPLKGYDPLSGAWYDDTPTPTLDYLADNSFATQLEMQSLLTTAHLIIRDLYEIFNYVEPNDTNLSTFSHRIYELLLRTATEFESNCKGVLVANGYVAVGNLNITDYFKLASVQRLSEYKVTFERWAQPHEFQPFATWNTAIYTPLPWYQGYNNVKHNRFRHFNEANLNNLMNAVSGLLCILHAQLGENMQSVCFQGISMTQESEDKVITGSFTIIAPTFPDAEQYEFIWDSLKSTAVPIQSYTF